jgi:hypothetical protein
MEAILMRDFMDIPTDDLARGYAKREDGWVCLLCGERFEEGIAYDIGGRLYVSRRAAAEHVRAAHGSVFLNLLETQQKYTGLTPHQEHVLRLMHEGKSDRAITEATSGAASTSAVRNLRFQLKERERQAKAYLALMEAFRLERGNEAFKSKGEPLPIHAGATMADERFAATEREQAAVLKAYFDADGGMREFPVREKRKIIALREIAGRFEKGREYTEKEVNALIAYRDFATVRRYLIEYGFLERSQDCSRYWVKE